MLNADEITIGSDPEFFISSTESGKVNCIPPILVEEEGLEILRQEFRDDEPEVVAHSFYYEDSNLKVMSDGAALELTVNPVELNNLETLYDNIQRGYNIGRELITPFNYNIGILPTIAFDVKRFNSKEKYRVASEAGCSPDYDAWDNNFECKVHSISDYPYRHGGAHIHFGITSKEKLNYLQTYSEYAVKLISMTIGSYFLVNSPQVDLDLIRMDYFGKPGKYRTPDHGIEYRSPSNAWTTKKEILLNAKEWILLGLNLIFHDDAEDILKEYSEPFKEAFTKQNFLDLKQIMEDIKIIYGTR